MNTKRIVNNIIGKDISKNRIDDLKQRYIIANSNTERQQIINELKVRKDIEHRQNIAPLNEKYAHEQQHTVLGGLKQAWSYNVKGKELNENDL